MSPIGNVKSSKKKRSMFRRLLFQLLLKVGTWCGRLSQARDELKLRGQHLRRCSETPEAFQKFLGERKLEVKLEAEERIARTAINPLELFPTEIWFKILENVQPEGLANMLEIHDVFEDIILLKKDLIQDIQLPVMLDFMLPIVRNYILCPGSNYDQWRHGLRPLLGLRRVCKSLRYGVDRWIEDHLLHLMRTYELVEGSSLPSLAPIELNHRSTEFDTDLRWERVLRVLDYSSGPIAERPKHFILRSMNISFCCDSFKYGTSGRSDAYLEGHGMEFKERFPVFKDNITEFLKSAGDQILHVNLALPRESHFVKFGVSISQDEIYAIVREWLVLLPNLKWLQINASDMEILKSSPDSIEVIAPRMPTLTMPTFRNLERFDFQGSVSEVPIWHSILDSNRQIKIINVLHPGHFGSIKRYKALCKAEFDVYRDPAVLTQPLELAHFGKKRNNRWDIAVLKQSIWENNWNLKRLTFWIGKWKRSFSMSDLFRFLQNFQSLEDVEIHTGIICICRSMRIGETFLLLPNLKRFKFELGYSWKLRRGSPEEADFLFSLMFLLECRKLESLDWVNEWFDSQSVQCHLEKCKGNRMIRFMGGFEDLCESNIWDVFPKLRTIRTRSRLSPERIGCETEYLLRKYKDRKLIEEKHIEWKHLRSTD